MANTGMGSDIEEVKRVSLLDVIEERNHAKSKKGLVHSMVVIANVRNQNHHEVASHYEKMFHDIQAQTLCEGGTGLLIFFPTVCIHILEGPLEILLEFMRDVRRDTTLGYGASIDGAKILVVSHDIPSRLFSQWLYTVQDISVPNIELYEPGSESGEKLVTDLVLQVLKLSAYLFRQPKSAMKTVLDSIHENVPELVPLQALIYYLINTHISCMILPEEYLRIYEAPYDVHLASDFVWPLPLRKLPYN